MPDEGFASPPCLMHEFATELMPLPSGWAQIRQWRAATRAALLERRAALDSATRRQRGVRAREHLLGAVQLPRDTVLGVYWPIRGELDVLELVAREHIAGGGVVALPVITQKHAPLEFWRWDPHTKMRRGFWNIPIPASPEPVRPDVLIIPLVGFDAAGYRLGHGGGYYDRTLAALTPRPLRIGLGHEEAGLATIHPQPHDIPMNIIATDAGVRRIQS